MDMELLEQIEEAFKIRDFNAAIELCQEAIKNDPSDEGIKQKLQKAIELQEAEPFLQSFISTGQTLLESGLCIDAIKQFEKVKVIDSTYPGLEDLIVQAKAAIQGDIYSSGSGSPSSTFASDTVATPTDEKVQAIVREGERLFLMGNYQQAIDTWSEVFMYDITNKQAHDLIEKARNELIMQKGQLQKFIEEARRLYEEKDYEGAEKSVRKALELDDMNEEARQFMTVVASKVSVKPEADLAQQAEQAYSEKDWKRALEFYQKLVEMQPDHPNAVKRISECKVLLQKKEQASKLVSDAQVFHMQGKKDSAIFALQKALEIDPSNKEADIFLNTIQSSASAPGAAVPSARTQEKKSMLIPIIVIVMIAVVVAGVIFYFRKGSSTPAVTNKPITQTHLNLPPVNQKPVITKPVDTTPVGPTVSQEKLLAMMDEAHNLYEQKNWTDALDKYKQILAVSPHDPVVMNRIKEIESTISGIAEKKNKIRTEVARYGGSQKFPDYEAVVRVLKIAVDEFPEDTSFFISLKDGYYDLGVDSLQKKQCAAALEYFKQISFLDPNDTSATAEIEIASLCSGKASIEPSLQFKIDALTFRPFNAPAPPLPPAPQDKKNKP